MKLLVFHVHCMHIVDSDRTSYPEFIKYIANGMSNPGIGIADWTSCHFNSYSDNVKE